MHYNQVTCLFEINNFATKLFWGIVKLPFRYKVYSDTVHHGSWLHKRVHKYLWCFYMVVYIFSCLHQRHMNRQSSLLILNIVQSGMVLHKSVFHKTRVSHKICHRRMLQDDKLYSCVAAKEESKLQKTSKRRNLKTRISDYY